VLFTPVPTTTLYYQYLRYIQARDWDHDLHMLNGKLFPFLEMNEGSINDYVDLQRLMFTLNAHYRNNSFQIFSSGKVASSFRENISNGFASFIEQYKEKSTT
jgi:hypothetical protein